MTSPASCPAPASAVQTTATFTTPGENVWTVPDGVTRVDVVAVGSGGGGPGTDRGIDPGTLRIDVERAG